MIYITGDTHAEFNKFSTRVFPEQNEMTRDDFVIICGDFGGVWYDNSYERYWLKWLSEKPFTILFVDGNHENFDRLYRGEFKVVDFHGGKAHKIRDNIYHLMRGYVYDICGKKFFAFGGASSHDIKDGVLEPSDYKTINDCIKDYKNKTKKGKLLRINHLSWWKEELPSEYEMRRGRENLKKVDYQVDYVISHCLPQSMVNFLYYGKSDADVLTKYFERLLQKGLTFKKWYSGHYHKDIQLLGDYEIFYHKIERII